MSLLSRTPALRAHNWLGVFLGVFLYLLCLSGTLVVFNQELERWEQPGVPEFNTVTAEAADKALSTFIEQNPAQTEHYHVVLPTSGIPRLVVENDHSAFFADQQGNLLQQEAFPFSKMILDLHYYLHLPSTWGLIVDSALGAAICALVVSGFFAHKRLVRDAFKLRRGGDGQKGRIDLHNRFGIWASPFHLVIGITGTYFGLAGVVLTLVAYLDYGGDRQAVMDKVFTPEPQLEQSLQMPEIGTALRAFEQMSTGHSPIFVTVHDVGTPQQFIELYAQVPDKMIYSENYRFTSAGEFIGTGGYTDGHWGKQLVYSLYRMHFGDFAGVPVKLLYFVLGVMLTALCVSGMDIWLQKQGKPARLVRLWAALVWGSVAALTLSALASLVTAWPLAVLFWSLLGLAVLMGLGLPWLDARRWLLICTGCLLVLLLAYVLVHGGNSFSSAAWPVNLALAGLVLWCGWRARAPVHQSQG